MGCPKLKTYDVVVTPKADNDLGEIFEYIAVALRAPETAGKLVTRLYISMQALSTAPFRCPLAKDSYLAKQGFRMLIADNYIAFYVVEEKLSRVIIHRVIYAKRDYLRLLKTPE
jgi:plasmid stabilization system protein ParE